MVVSCSLYGRALVGFLSSGTLSSHIFLTCLKVVRGRKLLVRRFYQTSLEKHASCCIWDWTQVTAWSSAIRYWSDMREDGWCKSKQKNRKPRSMLWGDQSDYTEDVNLDSREIIIRDIKPQQPSWFMIIVMHHVGLLNPLTKCSRFTLAIDWTLFVFDVFWVQVIAFWY